MYGARLAARSLGFALLAVLVVSVGPGRLHTAFAGADPAWLALAAPGFFLFNFAKALRWSALLRIGGVEYPLRRSLPVYLASSFLAFVTPGRVGDLAKAAYLRRDLDASWATGVASTLADRAFDLLVLAGAVALALLLVAPAGPIRPALGLGFAVLGAAAPVLAWPRLQRSALRWLARVPFAGAVARPLRRPVERVAEELSRLASPRLPALALLTALGFAALFGGAFALARGLHLPIDFATTSYAVSAAMVVALVPASVMAIGTRDAALIVLLRPFGVGAPEALSFSLAYLACSLLFTNGPGACCWLRDPLAPRAPEAAP
jgi:glycosyltransferase 2 family protein